MCNEEFLNAAYKYFLQTSKLGRVIVGSTGHTISVGGYTLGGGYSPIGRKFGMAVDNLLEVEMVTANGSLVYANISGTTYVDVDTGVTSTSTDNDIFWAVRGGGGSTYGIVTAFTYKLHNDSKMVKALCYSPMYDAAGHDVGRSVIQAFDKLASTTLAPEWGGSEVIMPRVNNSEAGTTGSVYIALVHYGEWGSPSFNTLGTFSKYCKFENKTNFLEYELETRSNGFFRKYLLSSNLQSSTFTSEYYSFLYDMFKDPTLPNLNTGVRCYGNLVGGNYMYLIGSEFLKEM